MGFGIFSFGLKLDYTTLIWAAWSNIKYFDIKAERKLYAKLQKRKWILQIYPKFFFAESEWWNIHLDISLDIHNPSVLFLA